METIISDQIYGWITPEGEIITTKIFGHYEGLIESDSFKTHFPDLNGKDALLNKGREVYEDAYNDFVDQMEPDEHPCWHLFNTSPEDEARDIVYDAGFVRFGTWKTAKGDVYIEFDCGRNHKPTAVQLIAIKNEMPWIEIGYYHDFMYKRCRIKL